ncbi:4Fe-4S dicluster domain-containing protein [Scrofimicrobium sp. R131]|uniref:4Fe-4S dicluster domain-containing protein n=1 Tax=Scrofimicrobium appendicitidis TaxID=3079930 RepID=A0AAU7V833_9ACTO
MTDPSRALLRWIYASDTPRAVVLACPFSEVRRVPKGTLVVEVPTCVDARYLGLAAQLRASGVDEVAVAETCSDAPTDPGRSWQVLAQALTGVHRWQEPSGRWGSWRPEVLYLGSIPLPRRLVLGLSVTGVAGPLDLHQSEHDRELQAFAQLRAAGQFTPVPVPSTAWRLAADGCLACGVCVQSCPHGALTLTVDEGTARLDHHPSACQGEGDCLTLCPAGALSSPGSLSLAELVGAGPTELARVPVARCARCQSVHHEVDQDYCQTCRPRTEQVFGVTADVAELIRRAEVYRRQHLGWGVGQLVSEAGAPTHRD